jgi:hypothetical protein
MEAGASQVGGQSSETLISKTKQTKELGYGSSSTVQFNPQYH